ncbi:flagellar hook-associated protein FlgL [Alkalicoccus daliensis]|uniref:Flagellar hook-associated protein 3 FlgL n=1 Tax=Alkalicoccus daliensis TaxID=745820 RepID=A0A1H0J0U7_9BACI|nr:flagellar hook-associated protein FlgL [Alkalicoccus daliensis]SDO37398.1 flagellar hook-associated protein 3 FlgL [Alkalicoccus daliensis]
MRVTQSMITMNSLSHLSNSYEQLKKSQDQLSTGKKISRASQDPVVAMNGIRYRTQVTETEQFKRNLSEAYNWMDSADSALDQTTQALHRIRELTVQASNDSYEAGQRANIAKEVAQLREHLESLANTKNNNKFIFNGTNTTNAPVNNAGMDVGYTVLQNQLGEFEGAVEEFPLEVSFRGRMYQLQSNEGGTAVFSNPNGSSIEYTMEGGTVTGAAYRYDEQNMDGETVRRTENLSETQAVISERTAVSNNGRNVEIELLKGVKVGVSISPQNVFNNQLFGDLKALENALNDPLTQTKELTGMLEVIDTHVNNAVNERAELGARVNRVEMMDRRVQEQEVIAKRIMSNNEDANMEEVITQLMSQENVHRAALASSSRIMQPSLMDFLR